MVKLVMSTTALELTPAYTGTARAAANRQPPTFAHVDFLTLLISMETLLSVIFATSRHPQVRRRAGPELKYPSKLNTPHLKQLLRHLNKWHP
jgi:hypothetical protein